MHQIFKDPPTIEHLLRGELGDHIDSYAALLSQQNYAESSAYKQLLVISKFSSVPLMHMSTTCTNETCPQEAGKRGWRNSCELT